MIPLLSLATTGVAIWSATNGYYLTAITLAFAATTLAGIEYIIFARRG
jgi:hypothetical protein